jgi:hypothetical protein
MIKVMMEVRTRWTDLDLDLEDWTRTTIRACSLLPVDLLAACPFPREIGLRTSRITGLRLDCLNTHILKEHRGPAVLGMGMGMGMGVGRDCEGCCTAVSSFSERKMILRRRPRRSPLS